MYLTPEKVNNKTMKIMKYTKYLKNCKCNTLKSVYEGIISVATKRDYRGKTLKAIVRWKKRETYDAISTLVSGLLKNSMKKLNIIVT